MKGRLWCVLAPMAGVLVACSAAPTPAAAPQAAAPTTAPAAATASGQQDLDTLVAAARSEGTISVSGSPNELWRQALTAFTNDYPGIQVEYTGADSRDFWPRLAQERQAGQYLWDVRIGGPDVNVFQAVNNGELAPVKPLLFLPEVNDPSKWKGGWDGFYADDQKQYLPGFVGDVDPPVLMNTDMVGAGEVQSELDLLNPKWKGQIVLNDPRGGAGLGFIASFLKVDGPDYLQQLLSQQEPIVTSDDRQIAEWLTRGQYPLAIGVDVADLKIFQDQGLGLNVQPLPHPKGIPLSIAFGGIQLIDHQPHPNATKLYVNWLLTQKTQTMIAQTIAVNSMRTDVPPGNPATNPDPDRLASYVPQQTQSMLAVKTQAQQMAIQYLNH